MTASKDDRDQGAATLSAEDVKDELRQFKERLLGVPGSVADMAKKAAGAARGDASAEAPERGGVASAPEVVTPAIEERLAAIEDRLSAVESLLREIRQAIP